MVIILHLIQGFSKETHCILMQLQKKTSNYSVETAEPKMKILHLVDLLFWHLDFWWLHWDTLVLKGKSERPLHFQSLTSSVVIWFHWTIWSSDNSKRIQDLVFKKVKVLAMRLLHQTSNEWSYLVEMYWKTKCLTVKPNVCTLLISKDTAYYSSSLLSSSQYISLDRKVKAGC